MKKGMIFNWINKDFNKNAKSEVKEDFERFSERNFLDERLEPEDKTFVKKMFYAMKKNEFFGAAYDFLAMIAGGAAGTGLFVKQAVNFVHDKTLMPAPLGDIKVFNAVLIGGSACLGLVSAYNVVKGFVYKDNAKGYRKQIDSIVDSEEVDYSDDADYLESETERPNNIVNIDDYRDSSCFDNGRDF